MPTPSMLDQIMTNSDLVYNSFVIKIIDNGEGISEEGL